ncbi:unnamed protein product [Urochloa humidicola]
MAVPNYTYQKLKTPGPKGMITFSTTVEHAYQCEIEYVEFASALVASAELDQIKQRLFEEAPNSNRNKGSFEPAEGVKKVLLDPSGSSDQAMQIGSDLDPK